MRILIAFLISIFITSIVQAAPLIVGAIDDNYPALEYSGTWASGTNAIAYGGGYYSTSDNTALLTFDTYATGFTVLFLFDPLGAAVDICIDADCVEIATTGAIATGRAEFTALTNDLKTVTISKAYADGNTFFFDGVYIHPESEATNTTQISYEYNEQTYTGSLEYSLSAGDLGIVILLAVVALTNIVLILQGFFK